MSAGDVGVAATEFETLFESRRRLGTKLLLDGREKLTYAELIDRVDRLPDWLRRCGVAPGGRVVVATQSAAAIATLFLGALRHDFTLVVLDPEASALERETVIGLVEPSLVLSDRPEGAAGVPYIRVSDEPAGGGGLLDRLLSRRRPQAQADTFPAVVSACEPLRGAPAAPPASTALVLFTSGTTSQPKGVELSRRALLAQLDTFRRVYGYDERSRILNPVPMHHTDGLLQGAASAFVGGGTVLRHGSFQMQDLPALMHAIYDRQVTHFIAVPTLLSLMLRLGPEFDDTFRTPHFRFIRSSAGYLDRPVWDAVEARFGVEVTNAYGLTECVCEAIYCGPRPETRRLGTIGKPIDVEVRFVDPDGRDVATGETGELLLTGPTLMSGYFRAPEETAKVLRDGWLATGDLASMDADGFVSIRGRRKNLVIRGGININPQEVSEQVTALAGVRDAVAVGMPDPVWGEKLVACVIADDGADLTPQAIIRHCRAVMAPEKVPNEAHVLERMPRGPAGKVVLSELKEMIAERERAAREAGAGTDVEERVYAVAASVFNVERERLGPDSNPDGTEGWDSFAHLTLMQELEQLLSIRFSPQEIMSIESLGELVAAVRGKTAS
ncbi:AMP-binding protein [Alsobacter sp. SYSU M60028]|uniref:AMP-binding protein n=1 Tax=Alsobacter ponti TaxID=2962936 RepID=A0ABT1LHN3_9HYPH|nr:AMP-binding protein [Alsobacter ponti]MCP8941009.1 AMP-binding protein [Alsobacter ponti]